MVPPRRAARPPVSYHESTPEEDFDDEDDEDDGDFDSSSTDSDRATMVPAPCRVRNNVSVAHGARRADRIREQPAKSYAEDSDEDDDEEFFDGKRVDSDRNPPVRKQQSRPERSKSVSRQTKNLARSTRKPTGNQQRMPLPPPKRRQAASAPAKLTGPSQQDLWLMGKACPWTSLPFEILRDILTYASYPLVSDHGIMTSNVAWLQSFRNMDPALLDASLAVLYYCPPITSSIAAHRVSALMSQKEARAVNYNAKVRKLQLEAQSTLAYSAGAELGPLNIGDLVRSLPQLFDIDIWSMLDHPDLRGRGAKPRAWSYPDTLFEALNNGQRRLHRFHWNARFLTKRAAVPTVLYRWMDTIHLLPAFQSLQYIKLTGFLGDSDLREDLHFPIGFSSPNKPLTPALQHKEAQRLEKKQEYRNEDEELAGALNALPNLRKLDFHMCSIIDGEWLQLLPHNLTHLGIFECNRLDSDGLQEFLESHGSTLRGLALKHNPTLSINFLTTFSINCPVLEAFSLDLKYFRRLIDLSQDGPIYENLLLPEQRPTWPSSLQSIEIYHLRQWSASAADNFFRSFVDSAKVLSNLRNLQLTASLDISWRERAKLRDHWEERFRRVFLRNATPPNRSWWSIHAFKSWKMKQDAAITVPLVDGSDQPLEIPDQGEPSTNRHGKRPAPVSRPSRRLRRRKSASNDEEASSVSLHDMVRMTLETHIQGMCSNLDVRIDNLRPTDKQFNEGDFLDDLPSGDEDWDEHSVGMDG